jgi:hypothetical protein
MSFENFFCGFWILSLKVPIVSVVSIVSIVPDSLKSFQIVPD